MKITNQELDLLHQIFSDYVENCVSGDAEEIEKAEELYSRLHKFITEG